MSTELYDSPLTMKTTNRRGHARSKSTTQPPTPPLYRKSLLSDQVRRAKTMSRCDSPQKSWDQTSPPFDDPEPEPVRRLRVMNQSAENLTDSLAGSLAKESLSMLVASPTISGNDDEGFVADERESFRDGSSRLLNGAMFNEPAPMGKPIGSQVYPSHATDSFKPSKRVIDRPPPKKADSGYSSGGSLRTMQRETSDEGTDSTSQMLSVPADVARSGSSDSNASSSLHTFEQTVRSPGFKTLSPPSSANSNVAFASNAPHTPHAAASRSSSRVADGQSFECDLPKSPLSTMSQFSIDSKTSWPRKLQKRKPSIQELPVVQSCGPVSEGTVPSVPVEVKHKFTRRLSESPSMDCLTRTYRSTDHVNDDASSSIASLSIRSPSPPLSLESQDKHHKDSALERPTSSRSGIRRSLSLFRSMSKTRKLEKEIEQSRLEKEAPTIVLDLGSIAMSLGQSPYDAAMAPTRRKSMTLPTHPHQLGNVQPEAKSTVNMDAETAIEFARMRSKDRALSRPSMPQRPRSFHAITRRIPYDLYEDVPDVPPVPPLPAMEATRLAVPSEPEPVQPVEQQPPVDRRPSASFRARTSGRGPVVAEIIEKFDQNGQAIPQAASQDWQPHAQLWSQRRKSIGEDLRQRAEVTQVHSHAMEQATVPQIPAKYTGPGIRQLHSYASRRSTHSSHRRGMSSSHVPMFLERA
jgi:hypothetical protein